MHALDFSKSVFSRSISIPSDAKIVFVADMFVDDYVGGAELTTEALVSTSPYVVFKLRSKDVTQELLDEGADRFWIFGNFAELSPQLITMIISNIRYSVLEYDYKYCLARSPEKHFEMSRVPCDCVTGPSGRLVSAFYYGAMGIWWMSERQKERYLTAFPFLAKKQNVVLSSVFSAQTLERMIDLRAAAPIERKGWIVLGSGSWIKGAPDAEQWCKDTGKQYDIVWNLPYDRLLERLSHAEGFVYLPLGGDTCPRMVIEAKLLGCKLRTNDNVQHRDEAWFATDELQDVQDHLAAAPGLFWDGITRMMENKPTLSGYVTTYDCVKQSYPFEQCIQSLLGFCDEVCVVDGGSTDGTWDELVKLAHPDAFGPDSPLDHIERLQLIEDIKASSYASEGPGTSPHQRVLQPTRLRLREIRRDWTSKRHPIFDGEQKARARAMCSKEYCWQMDADEVVHEDDGKRVIELCRALPAHVDILSLPVVEYWGGPDKVRMDTTPWKWRLSRNLRHITHGIPKQLRRIDASGETYAASGTDGCDLIHVETGEALSHATFYPPDIDGLRLQALYGDEQARSTYESWFCQVVDALPVVFHYSWYDLERKIRLYRDYWQNHWNALWDKDTADTADNNMMFGVPWKDVTDVMIVERAQRMRDRLGGWVWHRPWDGNVRTPHITCGRSEPSVMKSTRGKV